MEGYIGEIIMVPHTRSLGNNWLPCEGQIMPITTNMALYALIGTVYGGDGRTTFALPDLRGRVAIGTGQGSGLTNRTLGQQDGETTHVLTTPEIPAHTHGNSTRATINVSSGAATASTLANGVLAQANGIDVDSGSAVPIMPYNKAITAGTGTLAANSATVTVANSGNNTAHNNMQPYIAIQFAICVQGIFPPRD